MADFGGIGGAIGGIIGGLAKPGQGDTGEARNEAVVANQILQQIKDAPDISKPLILEQYRQQGILTPALEQQITTANPSIAKYATSDSLQKAQANALQSMQQRANEGLTAGDRAALNQARQATQGDVTARLAAIQQNMQERGQAGSGSELAMKLAAAQQGAQQGSNAADSVAQQSEAARMAAIGQVGSMAGQQAQQQFGQALNISNAQDQMNRFNTQNQIAQQQRNVGAQNQAQQYNLGTAQNLANANTQQNNSELQNQLQRQMQQAEYNRQNAMIKSGAAASMGNYLNQAGNKANQSAVNIGTGLGNLAGQAGQAVMGAFGGAPGMSAGTQAGYGSLTTKSNPNAANGDWAALAHGGEVKDYTQGGNISGQAPVPGDSPQNDIVHAKVSPGEIVVPRSMAQSPLGKHLLKMIDAHNNLKHHINGTIPSNKKQKKNYKDGGEIKKPYPNIYNKNEQKMLEDLDKNEQQFTPQVQPSPTPSPTPNYFNGGNVQPSPSPSPAPILDPIKVQQFMQGLKRGYAEGGKVSGYESLMNQYKNIKKYADVGPIEPNDSSEGLPEIIKPQYSKDDEEALEQSIEESPIKDKPNRMEEPAKDLEDKHLDTEDETENIKDIVKKGKEAVEPEEDKKEIASEDEEPEEDSDNKEESPKSVTSKPQESDIASQLKAAQEKRREGVAGTDIGMAGHLIASGLVNQSPWLGKEYFQGGERQGQLAMQDFNEKLANQKNDSNSEVSKITRDYLKSKGMNVNDNMSAQDLMTVAPFLQKDQALALAQAKALIAHEDRMKTIDAANQRSKDFNDTKREGFNQSNTRGNARLAFNAASKIELDPSVKKANDRLNSTTSAIEQLNDMNQPLPINKLNAIQIDLANTLNYMGSQGASDYKAKSDKLQNLNTRIAEIAQKYKGNIIDMRKIAPNVVKEVNLYANSVHDSATKIRDKQVDNLTDKYGKALGGDVGQRIKDIYTKKRNQPVISKGSLTSDQLSDYASKHSIQEDEARKLLTDAGYEIQ